MTVGAIRNALTATRALGADGRNLSPTQAALETDGTVRFVVTIPRAFIDAMIFQHRLLRFDHRRDLRAILAALDRLGRAPTITRVC